MILLGFY